MQTITPAQFAQMLEKINAFQPAREWAAGKTWETVYKTATPKNLLWLWVRTQINPVRKIFANILCDILRPVQENMQHEASRAVLPALEAWGRGKIINTQEIADAANDVARTCNSAAAASFAADAIDFVYTQQPFRAAGAATRAANAANADLGAILRKHAPIEAWDFSHFF